jgi:WD40 repeat protein
MILLQGVSGRVDVLAFSPDGRRLAAPCSRGVQLWDRISSGGRPTAILPVGLAGWSVEFTPDGRALLAVGKQAMLYDLERQRAVEVPLELDEGWGVWGCVTPDGRAVLVAERGVSLDPGRLFRRPLSDPTTSDWSVEVPRPIQTRPVFLAGGKTFVSLEYWTERRYGRWTRGQAFSVRDAASGAVIRDARVKSESYQNVTASADAGLLASWWEGWVAVFRVEDLNAAPVLIRNDGPKDFTGAAFHPSGRFLAATSNDNTVKLYDTQTWQLAHAFDWDVGRLRSIAFSPDGMLAAAGGDRGKVVVWDFDL